MVPAEGEDVMEPATAIEEVRETDLARECLYRFLGVALSDPRGNAWQLVLDPLSQSLARVAAELLRDEAEIRTEPLGFGELPPERLDLAPVLAELGLPVDELGAAYDRIFGLVPARECPPYETEYHSTSEAFFRAQQLADVAGFYRAFGLESAARERPDYLPLELEFMAILALKQRLAEMEGTPEGVEQAAVCAQAACSFFRDHLAWWVPAFAAGLRKKAGGGLYTAIADVLAALVPAERSRFGLPAPEGRRQPLSIEQPEEQAGCASCDHLVVAKE
jgi:TorA maturation chaperone TorD